MNACARRGVAGLTLFAILALAAGPACALVARLDDTASPRGRVAAQTAIGDQGRPLADAPGSAGAQVHFGTIDYRLATAPYVGHHARIYYVIPTQVRGLSTPAALRVSWRGLGNFASGSGHPGDRVPVWTGTVRSAWMDEALDLSMQIDLRQLRLPNGTDFGLESYFEIETLP
jgi:hypothetical protein